MILIMFYLFKCMKFQRHLIELNRYLDTGYYYTDIWKVRLLKVKKYAGKTAKIEYASIPNLSEEDIFDICNGMDNEYINIFTKVMKVNLNHTNFDIMFNNLLNNLDNSKEITSFISKNLNSMAGVGGYIRPPQGRQKEFIYNLWTILYQINF